jgi:hypothetical protein
MEIRLRSTGQVMYEGELRSYLLANGGPSYDQLTPEVMEAIGADVVFEGSQATPTRYQFAFRDGVTQDDQGRWFTKYSVSDMDQEAKDALDTTQSEAVRKQRTEKLAESDWTQVADSPVDKEVWATYRQALRDITTQVGFPWEITWPDAP